ncbi:hypothetical protein WG907_08355 [Sphingobium sp. AN558]|uniref:hypothetical protein n=1 Tax=Sphingobium sp. AN558 TaxID=3133442 RepID=UPI0030BD10FE
MASSPAPDHSIERNWTGLARPGWAWCALAAWMACCAVMLWIFHRDFPTLRFRDPDDAMRLQQVRDWIGGQGFFDVSQHRVNPPIGGPMHWSRIVDMPIAALILITRPLLGAWSADIFACAIAPLLTLGGLVLALYHAVRRLDGQRSACIAVALLLTAPSILVQFTPLRIDHHGWQIWMAAIALAGTFDSRPARGGVIAGLALAVWLQISSEGLPYAALSGGVFALRQWIARDHAPRFTAYAATLGGAAPGLLIALRGWQALFDAKCDALSAPYVWPLVALALTTPVVSRLAGSASATRRILAPAIGGGCALLLFLVVGGPCLSGDPFKALGPTAYKLWYLQVMEGRPIWEQGLSMAGVILLPALLGVAGAIAAATSQRDRSKGFDWLMLALLTLGATLVACLLMRAMTVAHLFALPGIAWLLQRLFVRIQAARSPLTRVPGSAALILLTPVGLSAAWIALITPPAAPTRQASTDCRAAATLAPLRALPAATLFAPLDIGPDILVQTRHSVIGTAHHRNAIGITAVIEGFTDRPGDARKVAAGVGGGKGAGYIVTCSGLNEFALYGKASRHGLAADLARGINPSWLKPMPGPGPLHIYRIVDQAGVKAIATPFMQ